MSTSKRINHPEAAPSPHISAAILSNGWIHVSGQGPLDMKTRTPIRGSIEEETRRTLANISTILNQVGGAKHHIVKCTCYLTSLADFDGFNAAYRDYFTLDVPPARTTLQAALLDGIKVEIDAIARLPQNNI